MSVHLCKQVIEIEHPSSYSPPMTNTATLLVVDDDGDVLTAARLLLREHFGRVLTTQDPADIEPLMASERIDVFLIDMNFAIGRNSGDEGLKWLDRITTLDPDAVVVLMTAFGDLNTAVRAMREGAADFVLKPWQNDKLVATLSVAVKLRQSRSTVRALSDSGPERAMIAGSPAMQEVVTLIQRVAPTDVNVLIRGENGTGKELIAQSLHRQSSRADKALVAVDLGAVAETLFESELFGHTKGAFTDAVRDRAGRFQAAHGGTLFLDEIGNLPLTLQNKLLRALESREIIPVGTDQPVSVDVRLICATNRPLEEMVADGTFREDLLYRVNTIEVTLPPLRERLEDLPALVEHFVRLSARKYRLAEKTLSDAGLRALRSHHWPGNIRELSHVVERALILSDGDVLGAGDFQLGQNRGGDGHATLDLEVTERNTIKLALEREEGNISRAARALGITRAALYRRIEKHGL